jgi:hypothetical protein
MPDNSERESFRDNEKAERTEAYIFAEKNVASGNDITIDMLVKVSDGLRRGEFQVSSKLAKALQEKAAAQYETKSYL